jgi:hypothetical protein
LPRDIDDHRKAEIPGKGHRLAAFGPFLGFGILRIDQQEEGENLLHSREMADMAGDRRRIEDMAEIHGEDR